MRKLITGRLGLTVRSIITTTRSTKTTIKPQNAAFWIHHHNHHKSPTTSPRPPSNHRQTTAYSVKHHEIEGPTVESDTSAVAAEITEVTDSMIKSMHDVTKSLAALGVLQLGVGVYVISTSPPPPAAAAASTAMIAVSAASLMTVSAVAWSFPIATAIVMRRSLKSMLFFRKMEKIGHLQLITCMMQISEKLGLFFVRLRVVVYTLISALLLSLLYSLLNPNNHTCSSLCDA